MKEEILLLLLLFLNIYGHIALLLARQYMDIRRLCKLDEEKIISVLNNTFFLAKYMGVCTA